MQVCGRNLYLVMPVLAGAAFRSNHTTAVDILEISLGKLVVPLCTLGLLAVNSQIPFAVFGKAVEADVFAFLHGGRLVLAPCISLVEYKSSFVDKLFGTLICALVKRHGHECSPLLVVTSESDLAYRRVGMPRVALRNRHGRAGDAMTAINSGNSFVGRGPKLTSFFDGDAADGPSANQKAKREHQVFGNGEFIIDGCQCSPRTEVLLR
jgi:hypothetical protein